MLKTGKRLKFLARASLIVLLSSCAPTPDGGESAVYEPDSGGAASGVGVVWEAADGWKHPRASTLTGTRAIYSYPKLLEIRLLETETAGLSNSAATEKCWRMPGSRD